MKNLLVLAGLCLFAASGQNALCQKYSRQDYIDTYYKIAVREMNRCGVPASIILAQGLLESDNGNSRLAVKANNHFGIKCHNGWTGKRIYHDDDAKNECFRKYHSAEASFIDHSNFLKNTSRYAFLFELDPSDYKGWAKGLSKAGYATSPKYADLLIKIIEDNNLHIYDTRGREAKSDKRAKDGPVEVGRTVFSKNRIKYIVVQDGDDAESLRKELRLLPSAISKYNELPEGYVLQPGEEVFIQPKRKKAAVGNDIHIFKEGESMWSISQQYGIKLEKLYEMNGLAMGEEPAAGTRLELRKKIKAKLFELPEEQPEPNRFQFEFEQ
jgi:LysM repeat protein